MSLHRKFGDFCCSRSGDMIAGIEIENGSCGPNHAPLRGFVIRRLVFDTFDLYAKFDDSSFNCPRDIIGGPKI